MPNKTLSFFFVILCLILVARPFLLESSMFGNAKSLPDLKISEVSLSSGLNFTHKLEFPFANPAQPWFEAIGANVAVVDINQDGYQDIFMVNTARNSRNGLFVNNQKGAFTEQSEKFGLNDLSVEGQLPLRPLFFDCDNDHQPELFITRVGCPSLYKKDSRGVYREHQRFSEDGRQCQIGLASNTLDINQDGLLDLVFAGTYGADHLLPLSFFNAENGRKVSVLLNRGNCRFEPSQDLLEPNHPRFYHSIGVGDFNSDDNTDLWAAVDFNHDIAYLHKNGKLVDTPIGYSGSRNGMNSEVAYLEKDRPHIFVSHISKPGYNTAGNGLWQYNGERFMNQAHEKGLYGCGWAWGGRFFDIDNDGDLDLAVTNGFYSGTNPRDYWFFLGTLSSTARVLSINPELWPPMKPMSLSGHEKDCLFINDGNNQFTRWDQLDDFDPQSRDGRAVATIDINNDGQLSLVVAQQKASPALYNFTKKNKNNWLGFELIGENWTAFGAKLRLFKDGHLIMTRANIASNVYAAQSDSRVHFGLGEKTSVDYVEITWPSGRKQRIYNPTINQYHRIEEAWSHETTLDNA